MITIIMAIICMKQIVKVKQRFGVVVNIGLIIRFNVISNLWKKRLNDDL